MAMLERGLPATFIVACGALVTFMQLGFTALESGLVDARNALSVLYKNLLDLCFGVISFSFAWWGIHDLTGTSVEPVRIFYDATFAATATTICSGALAGRIKLGPYVFLSIFITGVVYPLSAYLAFILLRPDLSAATVVNGRFYDMAGSVAVHAVGGFAALAAALFVGPRKMIPQRVRLEQDADDLGHNEVENWDRDPWRTRAHNMPLVASGAFILLVGWFGFNCGSARTEAEIGLVAFNTLLAGAAGGCAAYLLENTARRRPSFANNVNGMLGGLVAVTASANLIAPLYAILIGTSAGVVVVAWSNFVYLSFGGLRTRLEDPVGAFPVHGLCGVLGGLVVLLLPTTMMVDGEPIQLYDPGWQLACTLAFPAGSFILVRFFLTSFNLLVGDTSRTRSAVVANPISQSMGLDASEYVEAAYDFGTRSDKPEDLYERLRAVDQRFRPRRLSFDECIPRPAFGVGENRQPFSADFTHWLQEIELLAQQYADAYGRYVANGSTQEPAEPSANDLAARIGMAKRALAAYSREPTPAQKKVVFNRNLPSLEAAVAALGNALSLHASQRIEGNEVVEKTNRDLVRLQNRVNVLEARVADLGHGRVKSE